MCGIVALFAPEKPLSSDDVTLRSQLDSALGKIAHRGPDAQGVWISGASRCGASLHSLPPLTSPISALAHCRLAINDLTPDGTQPLHSPSNHIHAVVNGEIYSHSPLRTSLQASGYVFKGHSDSELVLALYQLHGLSFLSHLRGEFALCLYDEQAELFIAARDRYGIKPLFWRIGDGGRVELAAEIKAFLGLGWEAEWDVAGIVDGGWGQDTRTLFKGVQKVSPTPIPFVRWSGLIFRV